MRGCGAHGPWERALLIRGTLLLVEVRWLPNLPRNEPTMLPQPGLSGCATHGTTARLRGTGVAMSALSVPDVEDQWSLSTDVSLGTVFAAPRGVKDLLRQRRSSTGEGKRPTTSSSQPVTPPIMPGDEDGRARRDSGTLDERLCALAMPEQYELEPEPEPSPAKDRKHEERERQRRRRRKKDAKQHADEGECAEVASWEPSSGSIGPPRQRTPEYPLATSGTQSPRARKAAHRAVDRPTGEACRASHEARARRRDKMHNGRKEDGRSRILQRGGCATPHATPAEGKATATTKRPAAAAPQIRLLVETESTQTDDDLLQELLRRRRAYLNEQSQLDGRESASVIKAHEEADQFFAQASQRAREEAMKTVDASTCLKAALWNGSQQRAQELGAPQASVPGSALVVPGTQGQIQNQLELAAEAAAAAKHVDIRILVDAGKQTATAQKNTRGFRLRR